MPANTPPLTLYTFAMSHYSEKIRWTLDKLDLPYREVCMTPVFHIGPALRMGGRTQTTLRILQTPEEKIQDSPRILDWLIAHHGPFDLVPQGQAQAVRAIERRFDAIGKDVARFLYAHSFGSADAHILRLWTAHASPGRAAILRAAYPLVRWAFKRKLNITQQGAERAHQRITEVIDWLDMQLAQGRIHLVGQQLSTADITAAALLAPLACPTQHPIYGEAAFKHSMRDAIAPWRDRPALQWVRALYDTHRGAWRGGAFSPQDNIPRG